MPRWRLFSKSKSKEEEIIKPQEEIKKEEIIREEDKPLAEYKETIYTSAYASKKGRKQVLSDQRIWRDVDSIEKNIDNLDMKEAKKPITNLEKKVDKIISKIL